VGSSLDQALARRSRVTNLPSWVPDWSVGRSKSTTIGEPWPKPLQVYPSSKAIIFRAICCRGASIRIPSVPSVETPVVYFLFDLENDNTKTEQTHLYFSIDSPLFFYLQAKVQGWMNLAMKPISGTIEILTKENPAYKITNLGVKLQAVDLHSKSCSWSSMSISNIRELLQMSYHDLINMLFMLRGELPLDLAEPIKEWGAQAGCLYFQITEGNLSVVIDNLRELANNWSPGPGPIQWTSTGNSDSNKIPTQMALQLLIDNYKLEHAICIL
jgi:hypothetical protein